MSAFALALVLGSAAVRGEERPAQANAGRGRLQRRRLGRGRFLFALRSSGAARLTGLRNTSVVFAALGWAQGEPRGARSIGSALAIAAGAILLAGRAA